MFRCKVFLTLAIFCILPGCGNDSSSTQEVSKPLWVATTGMIGDVLRSFAPDSVDVRVLMGPGVDPHLYKATQSDLVLLRKASLIVYNGLHLEGKMGDILQALHQKTNTIAMAELLPSYRLLLADSANSIADPHIWFDVQLWQEAARLLLDTISRSHPTNSRAMTYLDSLQILHTSLLSTFDSLPPNKRILVTAHDAFGYFGRAYGFQVRGLQGISTLSDFGVKDVTTLADFVVKAKVPALFVENSIPPRTIQSVLEACRRSGHPVELGGELYSDALGASDGSAGTYMGMIRQNANTIFRALEPKLP